MKTRFTAFLLATFSLIIAHTMLAADKEFDWYVLGSMSMVFSKDYSLNGALGVGAGKQINERIGIELSWDISGIEPRDLIQKANLPQTIAPLQIDVQSDTYQYLSALAVRTFPLREPFSLVGKAGIALHWQSLEFDVGISGSAFTQRYEVDESEILPVAALGFELASNRFKALSFEVLVTNYFGKSSSTGLFTAAVKIKF